MNRPIASTGLEHSRRQKVLGQTRQAGAWVSPSVCTPFLSRGSGALALTSCRRLQPGVLVPPRMRASARQLPVVSRHAPFTCDAFS